MMEIETISETKLIHKHSFVDGTNVKANDVLSPSCFTQFSFADEVEGRLSKEEKKPKELLQLRYTVNQVRKYCKKFNQDWLFLVCGGEGVGKSNFALQLAELLDPKFDMESQMVYSFNDDYAYLKFIDDFKAKPFRVVVFDEAVTALFSREHAKGEVKDAIKIFNMNRQLNHFSILVVPSFWSMDIDIRQRRARTFFYVFQNEYNFRRYYAYYSRIKIAKLSNSDIARKLFLSPSMFLSHIKPNYIEHFPQMSKRKEGKYLKMKKNYFFEMMSQINEKYGMDDK